MSITHSVLVAFLDSNKSAAEYTNENALPLVLFKELLLEFLISNYRNDILLTETEFSEKKSRRKRTNSIKTHEKKTSIHKKQSLEARLEETLEKNRKIFNT